MDRETLEVLDKADDCSRIGPPPLGAEAVHPPAGLLHGKLPGRLGDLVADLPPVGLEGVLIGSGDLGDGASQAVRHAAQAKGSREDLLDHRDQSRRAVGDDEERRAKSPLDEPFQEVPAKHRWTPRPPQ